MATISKILKSRLGIIEGSPGKLLSSVEKAQVQVLREIEDLLGKLQFEGNELKVTQKNFSIIEQIDTRMRIAFNKSDYVKGMKEFVGRFKDIEKLNIEFFKKEFKVDTSRIVKTVIENARKQSVDLLIGQGSMDTAFFNPIKETLIRAVTSQSSFSELVTNIRNIAIGTGDKEGKLLRHAKQIAKDTLNTADRSISSAVMNFVGADFCQYVGLTKDTTRCFCDQRAGKFFHVKEVMAWGSGDLSAGGLNNECDIGDGKWAGWKEGTNESTIFDYAGGHECNHAIVLRSAASVPKEVIQRAIDAGYYKPSKKEREALGL